MTKPYFLIATCLLLVTLTVSCNSSSNNEIRIDTKSSLSNIPQEVENSIRDLYSSNRGGKGGWKIDDVSQIEVSGKGIVLPVEENFGIEEIYCANVQVDARDQAGSDYFWFSYIVQKTGNYWETLSVFDFEWDQHSCPGEYKEARNN